MLHTPIGSVGDGHNTDRERLMRQTVCFQREIVLVLSRGAYQYGPLSVLNYCCCRLLLKMSGVRAYHRRSAPANGSHGNTAAALRVLFCLLRWRVGISQKHPSPPLLCGSALLVSRRFDVRYCLHNRGVHCSTSCLPWWHVHMYLPTFRVETRHANVSQLSAPMYIL